MKLAARLKLLSFGVILACLPVICAADPNSPVRLSSPSAPLEPGAYFSVDLIMDLPVDTEVYSYYFRITYDPALVFFQWVWAGAHPEFMYPYVYDDPMQGVLSIQDYTINGGYCTTLDQAYVFAFLDFMVSPNAPMGVVDSPLSFIQIDAYVSDCVYSSIPISSFEDGRFSTIPFTPTTYGFDQYLDMDGNWGLSDSDVNVMWQMVNDELYDTSGGQNQLKIGGLQGDMDGNLQIDYYDLGWMDALARTIRFINSGDDGICNTTANIPEPPNPDDADDTQDMAVNQGLPDTMVINGDVGNFILESSASGDDQVSGNLILSGPDGIAQSTAGGDDEQLIPVGYGMPHTICVSPGWNGNLVTSALGDDELQVDPKPVANMLNEYGVPGAPAQIFKIFPENDPSIFITQEPVPIIVSIVDDTGVPRSGIAPVFVAQGGGTFQESGTNTVSGFVSDRFLDRGDIPTGQVAVTLNPVVGGNTVEVYLAGDPNKGIPDCGGKACDIAPVTFRIIVEGAVTQILPDTVTLSADVSAVYPGQPINLTVTLKDGLTAASGFGDGICLVTNVNLQSGIDLNNPNSPDNPLTVFIDDFESGVLSGWSVDDSCGTVSVDSQTPGFLGVKTLRISGHNSGACHIKKLVSTSNFMDIMVSYQWSWIGSPLSGYIHSYWSVDGVDWFDMQYMEAPLDVSGNGLLYINTFNLSYVNEIQNNQVYVRFGVSLPDEQKFILDNFMVAGKRILFKEDFQSGTVGAFPASMDPAAWITTGPDGICQTTAQGDDQQVIPLTNGKPYFTYIFSGNNQILDSIPGGDDQIVLDTVNTGANGIAETIALVDDFQQIPYGQGDPFTIAIKPGLNGELDTSSPGGDDEIIVNNGNDPRVKVDDSIYPDPSGENKFLFLGRAVAGPNVESYAVQKILNLQAYQNATLIFKSRTIGMTDNPPEQPAQQWILEVSDNDGKSWVPVWDFAGMDELDWTEHWIQLTNDPRFQIRDNFIIRWRATMDSTEDGADTDAVYIDDILVFASAPPPNVFAPLLDLHDGTGRYRSSLTSFETGNAIKIGAIYFSRVPGYGEPVQYYSNAVSVNVNLRKVDPNSVRIIPQEFDLKACKSQNIMVTGHFLDLPEGQVENISDLFDLVINGPAKMTAPGVITMDCYRGLDPFSSEPIPITVHAIPRVPGLYDPVGTGTGVQTGNLSGRVYTPAYAGAADAPIVIDMGGIGKIYSKADSSGYYLVSGVPAGTGFVVDASKVGYTRYRRTTVSVSAGLNTAINATLASGANFDGDSYMDSTDLDKDNDGIIDTSEANNDCRYRQDCDFDGYPDTTDEFPTNASEWEDTDNDGTGDNTDADDDGDGILDSEETIPGTDGYVTDPEKADTDSDLMSDYYETHNGLNPTLNDAALDKDKEGRRNYDEYLDGTNPAVAEPVCGEGAYCFADSDGNGIIEVPDLVGLNSVLGGIPANWTQVIPTNGDQMDLDGNGVIEVPDLILINSLIGGSLSGELPGQADAVNLESSQNVTTTVGQWTKLTVNLTSSASAGSQKRSGYGAIFYVSSTSSGGTGEFWGGDKASTSRSGGRWCTTLRMVSEGGRSEIWFKATHTGHVYIQAEAPASAIKHTKQVQLVTPVHVTIN